VEVEVEEGVGVGMAATGHSSLTAVVVGEWDSGQNPSEVESGGWMAEAVAVAVEIVVVGLAACRRRCGENESREDVRVPVTSSEIANGHCQPLMAGILGLVAFWTRMVTESLSDFETFEGCDPYDG
jgi:hypothetical protein